MRHPDKRAVHAIADVLEGSWRALARRHPVAVVGPELGRQYAGSAALLVLYVSLIRAAEISDPESERERSWDGEPQLLSVGRIDAEKNPLLLADILARLNAGERRWRMVICGAGPMEDALRARLEELGVADRAELAGYVPAGDELMAIYRSSHAFLHVSFTEGVPQVLFEAFAAALPVVATDVGGVGQATGTDAALLVPPGELEPPVDALERLAADPALRLRLVESGADRVRRHTLEAEIGRLAAFLREAFSPR
jgi:glycosyltransferase involved in cell wall biosynthesis